MDTKLIDVITQEWGLPKEMSSCLDGGCMLEYDPNITCLVRDTFLALVKSSPIRSGVNPRAVKVAMRKIFPNHKVKLEGFVLQAKGNLFNEDELRDTLRAYSYAVREFYGEG